MMGLGGGVEPWDMPPEPADDERCPSCGSDLVETGPHPYCSSSSCGFCFMERSCIGHCYEHVARIAITAYQNAFEELAQARDNAHSDGSKEGQ